MPNVLDPNALGAKAEPPPPPKIDDGEEDAPVAVAELGAVVATAPKPVAPPKIDPPLFGTTAVAPPPLPNTFVCPPNGDEAAAAGGAPKGLVAVPAALANIEVPPPNEFVEGGVENIPVVGVAAAVAKMD